MRTIQQVLDAARAAQKVQSDYKLSMVTGIREGTLSSYRLGKTLPDEKHCVKLAEALGEDSGFLILEMQANRARDPLVKSLYENLWKRLQKGVANVQILIAIAMVCIAVNALPYWAATYAMVFTGFQSVYYVKRVAGRALGPKWTLCKDWVKLLQMRTSGLLPMGQTDANARI